MKCIKAIRASKDVQVGDIKRVDDKTAMNMVGLSWQYVSKTEWKNWRGVKTKTDQVTDEETDQVKKKSNPKQMDGKPSTEPFVKTRKKSK